MKINYQQIKKLPVLTESGHYLGRVKDMTIDVDSQGILKYVVKKNWIASALLIDMADIINIDQEKIVVRDAVVKSELIEQSESTEKEFTPSPAIEKSID